MGRMKSGRGDLNVSNEWRKKESQRYLAEEADKIDWYSKIKVEGIMGPAYFRQIAGWQELGERKKEIRCESLHVMRNNIPVTVSMRDVCMILTSKAF